MRKILCIYIAFMIFFLSSCQYTELVFQALVSSIHLAVNEDSEFEVTFYLCNSNEIGKSEGDGQQGDSIALVKNKNLLKIFNDFEESTPLDINYRHISTMVFDESFMKREYVFLLVNYIVESSLMDFNFYIFASHEKAEDLYSLKQPDNISNISNIFNEPLNDKIKYSISRPVHFTEFCRAIYCKTKTVKLPVISLTDLWDISGEKVKGIKVDGIAFHLNNTKFYYEQNNFFLLLLNSFESYMLNIDEHNIFVNSYDFSIKPKKKNVHVCVKININNIGIEEKIIKDKLTKKIKEMILYMYAEKVDILLLNDLNRKYNRQYVPSEVEVKLDIKI